VVTQEPQFRSKYCILGLTLTSILVGTSTAIMETKTHSRDTYKAAGQISWIEQDLLDCSGDLKSSCKRIPLDENSTEGRDNNFHVCVVDAGFAGLRCAEVLLAEGVRVTILEARDRLGGRVC